MVAVDLLIDVKKAPFQRLSVSQRVDRIGYVILIHQLLLLAGEGLRHMLGDVVIAEQLEQVQPDGRNQPSVFPSANFVNLDKKSITLGLLMSSRAAHIRSMPSSSPSPSSGVIIACRSL